MTIRTRPAKNATDWYDYGGDLDAAARTIDAATTVGLGVLKATDATAARTAIGAGTSNLALGTSAGTAKAGTYAPAAADISDATAVGVGVLKAADAAAARTAIGAGTSSFSGAYTDLTSKPTIPSTPAGVGAAPAVHTHVAADITDATTVGRNVLKAADAAAARSAIGAGTSSLAVVKLTQAAYDALATKDANTFYAVAG